MSEAESQNTGAVLASDNSTAVASDAAISSTTASTSAISQPDAATSASSTTPPTTSTSTSLTSRLLGVPDSLKVIVHFRAVGDAPQLKKSKFMLSASYRFIVLIDFLRKHLHYKPTDTLVTSHTHTHCTTTQRHPMLIHPHPAWHLIECTLVCCVTCCFQFLFCNASFSPSPDALIYDLFQCFQLNNELVINYATQDAWG